MPLDTVSKDTLISAIAPERKAANCVIQGFEKYIAAIDMQIPLSRQWIDIETQKAYGWIEDLHLVVFSLDSCFFEVLRMPGEEVPTHHTATVERCGDSRKFVAGRLERKQLYC
jgi:hypothetical protein